MFRTRPPAFALACVGLWGLHLAVNLVQWSQANHWNAEQVHRLQTAGLLLWGALGILLLVQLPRALQWRPRRSKRPSREIRQERQRIARDLHDHVGSRIVGAMALVDARDAALRPLVQALEQCLLELRLVVDSMDASDDSLPERLARLRHRLQPALERRGMALHWQVDTVSEELPCPAGAPARELAAIAQEALSNALQHSGASALTVRLAPLRSAQGDCWCLQIIDNGRNLSFDTLARSHAGRGHGLAGMRRRAAVAGGKLELLSAEDGGLCVQVVLPVQGFSGLKNSP